MAGAIFTDMIYDWNHTTFDGSIRAEKLIHRDIIHAVFEAGAQEEPGIDNWRQFTNGVDRRHTLQCWIDSKRWCFRFFFGNLVLVIRETSTQQWLWIPNPLPKVHLHRIISIPPCSSHKSMVHFHWWNHLHSAKDRVFTMDWFAGPFISNILRQGEVGSYQI